VVLVRILMLKSGFEDEVLIKLIVGVASCEACRSPLADELMSLDLLTIEAGAMIDFCREQLRRESQ
jgi:hypothetical protein